MSILNKIRPEEQDFLEDFQEMVIYHIKQMQQCLFTAGKLFYGEEDRKEVQRCGRDVLESVILKECVGCRECEERCPFGVPIAERMEKTAELFGC